MIYLAFIIGLITGFVITYTISNLKMDGILHIDHSIEDEPAYIFLELKDTTFLETKKYAKFTIKKKDFLPRD